MKKISNVGLVVGTDKSYLFQHRVYQPRSSSHCLFHYSYEADFIQ